MAVFFFRRLMGKRRYVEVASDMEPVTSRADNRSKDENIRDHTSANSLYKSYFSLPWPINSPRYMYH